jgi:hypothetical protein
MTKAQYLWLMFNFWKMRMSRAVTMELMTLLRMRKMMKRSLCLGMGRGKRKGGVEDPKLLPELPLRKRRLREARKL